MGYSSSDLFLNNKIRDAAQTADHITTYNLEAITNNIGKWIDGKDIHRIIFDVSAQCQDLSGGDDLAGRFVTIDVTSTWPDYDNVETVIDFRVIIRQPDTGVFTNGAYMSQGLALDQDFGFTSIYNGAGVLFVVVGKDGPVFSGGALSMFIIIEYTKITV